jgi:uncharacterized protein YhaN
MKITDIQIGRFGVWRDLSLPLTRSGLSVFYGPNEAGKTTLLRFVRGVLYGFGPQRERRADGQHRPHFLTPGCDGLLRVDHRQRLCDIRRATDPHHGHCGLLSVTGLDHDGPADELLAELLSGVGKEVFDSVFAVGLHELQELATLEGDEVAQHVYGLSLGLDGQRLLAAAAAIDEERDQLFHIGHPGAAGEFAPEAATGELAGLVKQHGEVAGQIGSLNNLRDRHAALCEERACVQKEIGGLKSRQAGVQSQLRGHLYLERIFTPWSRARGYRAELEKLPVVLGFPDDGLARLDELDQQLASLAVCRDSLLSEAAQLRKTAEELPVDPEVRQHSATIQSFIDQRGWVLELNEKIAASEAAVAGAKESLEKKQAHLGPEWSPARLDAADTSPAAHFRLVSLARHYQAALSRRGRIKRRIERLSALCQQRSAHLDAERKQIGGKTIDEALFLTRQRLTELEDLGHIRLREAELEQRRIGIDDQLRRLEDRLSLPTWVYVVLAFFGVSGLIFSILGIVTGVTTSGIAGAAYALLGTTCGGLAWALKVHFEGQAESTIERLQDEARENEVRLRETRSAILRLTGCEMNAPTAIAPSSTEPTPDPFADATWTATVATSDGSGNSTIGEAAAAAGATEAILEHGTWSAAPAPPDGPRTETGRMDFNSVPQTVGAAHMPESELIRKTTHRLTELEQLAADQRRIQIGRRRLAELRSRFQGLQREVSTARQSWCEALTQSGFAESVKIDDAFDAWQRVVEAQTERRAWKVANAELQSAQRALGAFRQRLEDLGRRIQCWDLDYTRPLDVLAAWEESLKLLGRNQIERRRLRRDEKTRRREAAGYQSRIDEAKMQRAALMVQAGAANREEFEQRALWLDRRAELEQLLTTVKAELESAARTEPDLTVVEEDLLDFQPEENNQCIQTLNRELEDLEGELQAAFERLGGLKQEIQGLENDRRSAKLGFEREQIAGKLKRAAERWFALHLAERFVDQIRSRYERTHQPATLAAASHFLRRLTGGKYANIWTPLGQRHLCIDDEHGETLRVEQLSNGTREQLFLAIRLAMVREFANQGVELPMVLDDIIVNFDQLRTEAAVDTLLEFAEQGQQILLFTCHLHLAHLFESKGIEPIWLPSRAALVEERRAG